MKSKWKKTTLGELGTFRNGVNFNNSNEGYGIPIVKVKDFQSRTFVPEIGLDELDTNSINISNNQLLEEGDVVIVRSNGNRDLVGRSLFYQKRLRPITFSGFCIRFRPNKDVDPLFVSYFIKSPFCRQRFSRYVAGTNIQNLSQDILSNLPLSIPPLTEQKRISKIFKFLDDRIELINSINNKLEQITRATFKSWFIDFDGHTEFVDSKLGEIPKNWMIKKLIDVVEPKKFAIVDGPFGTQLHKEEYTQSGIPVIKISNLSFEGHFLHEQLVYITKEKFNDLIRSSVYPGDILLAKTGNTIGKFSILPSYVEKALISSSILKISPNQKKFNKYFLYNTIQNLTENDYWNLISSGSTRPTISLDDVKNIEIIYPPDEIMEQYFQFADIFYKTIEKNRIELQYVSKIRDSLLPKLLSGEITI